MAKIYTTSHPLDFKEPTDEEVKLGASLARTIKSFHKSRRESLFHLCILAYGLRKKNLHKVKGRGGNQRGEAYKPQFEQWYEKYEMSDVYGKLTNFTLYAMSGRLLTYVRWQIDNKNGSKYIDQLPSSLSGLYALSKIIWTQGESATDKTRKLFFDLLTKPIKDGRKDNKFIHQNVSRKEINDWIEKNQKPKVSKTRSNNESKKNNHNIVLATIKVDKKLFEFNRSGTKRSIDGPTINDVKKLENKINSLIQDFKDKAGYFSVESKLDEVRQKYENERNKDFGSKIK